MFNKTQPLFCCQREVGNNLNGHPVDYYLDQELYAAVDDAVVDVLLRAEVDLGVGRPRGLLSQLALQLLRRLQAVLRGHQERADQHL